MFKIITIISIALTLLFSVNRLAFGQDALSGSEWGFLGEDMPFINFGSDGKATGYGGCNRFTGKYKLKPEGGIVIGPLASTRKFCPGGKSEAEHKFFKQLEKTVFWRRDGTRLYLKTQSGDSSLLLVQRDWD